MIAASQREQALKFEVLVQIAGDEPTAVASFNYHHDHFTAPYGLGMADGGVAHTACLGFGLERISARPVPHARPRQRHLAGARCDASWALS